MRRFSYVGVYAIFSFLVGCFSPTYPAGQPCAPDGWCPPGQSCSPDNICVATEVDARGPDSSGAIDAAVPADAPGIDADPAECANQPDGTACGSQTASDCTDPDTCDGNGACLANHKPDQTNCNDCAAGPGYCDSCLGGVCENISCDQNSCYVDAECSPAATSGTCVDLPDDCDTTRCIGGAPPTPIEGGVAAAVDLGTWQSYEDPTNAGQGLWYCNASLPVTDDGLLDAWTLAVAFNGQNGEQARLAVIRCGVGGGGGGPALSNCTRVGLGPVQTITGNGIHNFTLAGSTQLDGAPPDAGGIVVRNGDILCASGNDYRIGVDCNGSSLAGGCPGPDFDTQYQNALDTVAEPFSTLDSVSDGVLMIKATGATFPVLGQCTDTGAEEEGVACSVDGGDTCCNGDCVTGPCP